MTVLSYTPSHVGYEILERLTTGASRQRLIETLVEAVRSEIGRRAHQHHLLIGPRGSGKTHALTLVAHRLRSDPELAAHVLPISLAEEEVARHPADLMRKVLERLVGLLERMEGDGVSAARRECLTTLAVLRSEADDDRALEIALGALEEAAARLGRLLVAILENFDSLLYSGPALSRSSAAPGQWALRRQLQSNPGLVLLAAAPTLFGEVCDPRAPFYDFFRVHTLEELPPAEMVGLIRTRLEVELGNDLLEPAQQVRLQSLAGHFEERIPRLRGVLTLTGGLPRFAHLLFDLLAETDIRRTVDVVTRFLDAQTPYFQPRLDPRLVPEAELEVLDFLAASDGPRTTAEIAAGLRAKSLNVVTTYLKRLRERGLVRSIGTSRKDLRYDLAEPLFRVWRRFRIGRSGKEQILVLAEFVAALFERPELEAGSALADFEIGEIRRRVIETALKLQDQQSYEASSVVGNLISEADRELRTGFIPRAFELYTQAVQEIRRTGDQHGLARHLGRLAYFGALTGRSEEALLIAKEGEHVAVELGDQRGRAHAISARGRIDFFRGDFDAALRAFQQAEPIFREAGDDLGLAYALDGSAHALFDLGDSGAAIQFFHDAEELFRKIGDDFGRAFATLNRGNILFRLGDKNAARQAFRQAEELGHKTGSDLALAGSHWGFGRLAISKREWESGIDHLVTAYELTRKAGHRHDIELVRRDTLSGLLQAAAQTKRNRVLNLLKQSGPLLRDAGGDEDGRHRLVQFSCGILARLGPEIFLETLPLLEAGLPGDHSTLLRPSQLAAEIRSRQRSETLPEQTDEMRRAVRSVFEQIDAWGKAPSQTHGHRPGTAQRKKVDKDLG